jgi:hypothetical protein
MVLYSRRHSSISTLASVNVKNISRFKTSSPSVPSKLFYGVGSQETPPPHVVA